MLRSGRLDTATARASHVVGSSDSLVVSSTVIALQIEIRQPMAETGIYSWGEVEESNQAVRGHLWCCPTKTK